MKVPYKIPPNRVAIYFRYTNINEKIRKCKYRLREGYKYRIPLMISNSHELNILKYYSNLYYLILYCKNHFLNKVILLSLKP